jgi:hypothetical protein
MARPIPDHERHRLLSSWCDGTIADAQVEQLEALLRTDPEFRAFYLAYMDLHATLAADVLPAGDRPSRSEGVRAAEALLDDEVLRKPLGRPRGPLVRWARVGIAAAAVLVVGLGVILWPRGRREASLDARPSPPAASATGLAGLAMVVKLDGARWEPSDGPALAEGVVVPSRRLRLSSGRATLAFLSGVMLTLEGPADLELVSIDRVFCHRGKLRARVPHGAEGFVVAAPGSSVVDLGTEFGLNVEDDGRARVMVFEGEAEAAVLGGAAGTSERSQLVEQSKAFDIDPRSGDITEAVASTEGFVTSPDLAAPALDLDPSYPVAVLESRPWGYWRFEAMADGAVPNEVAGGPPLRATGPMGIADAGRGNGCAEFDASGAVKFLELDGLWEPPRDPGYAVELWAMSEEYNHSTIVALLAPMAEPKLGHFALLELLACGRYPFPPSATMRFLHRWPPGGKGGVSVQNGITYTIYRWHHLVAQGRGDRMEFYMDGLLTRSRPLDPDRSTAPCRMVLGRLFSSPSARNAPDVFRPFHGRLDEVALYDHPLSAEEVQKHYQLATQGPRRR